MRRAVLGAMRRTVAGTITEGIDFIKPALLMPIDIPISSIADPSSLLKVLPKRSKGSGLCWASPGFKLGRARFIGLGSTLHGVGLGWTRRCQASVTQRA